MNPELGLYAYCVIDGGHAPEPRVGVDPRYRTRVLRHGALGAVISEVTLREFSEDALKERLEDIAFLESTARAHDEVTFGAHAADASCPLPLCTIFAGPDSVREMLAREHKRLRSALDRIRGHDEWSVKLLAERPARTSQPAAPDTSSSPGHAFFERKRAQRQRERSAGDALARTASRLHRDLTMHAAESRLLRPQNRAISAHRGEMALNAAYLVERQRSQEFAALLEEFAADGHRDDGLTVALSGPFAPYSFVGSNQP
jgi:hypothetical protein